MMEHCMIDLETLGKRAGCMVLSIGAVMFDPEAGTLGEKFYREINQQSSLNRGLYVDSETAAWWRQQNNEAQGVLRRTMKPDAPTLDCALGEFANWLREQGGEQVKVWGNGASFDNPILNEAFHKAGIVTPWEYWNDSCYRTLKRLGKKYFHIQEDEFVGVKHHALADAEHQARHAIKCLTAMQRASTIVGK